MVEIPKRLRYPAILDCTVELRFKTNIPGDAIFGLVYDKVQKDFSQVEKLPILQLPDELRSKDPSLRFKPYYKLFNDDYVFQVGPTLVSLHPRQYPGWSAFSSRIDELFGRIVEAAFMTNVTRVGLRYINGFSDRDIFRDLNLSVSLLDAELTEHNLTLRTERPSQRFITTLQISNHSTFTIDNQPRQGSVFDLDTYTEKDLVADPASINSTIHEAHEVTKKLFFDLIKPKLLDSLGPEY